MDGQAEARRWWGGALDVEGLALGSVAAVATALNDFTESPGRFGTAPALTAAAFDSFGHLRIDGRKLQGFAPLSGFKQTADGWIRIHANYPHHERRLLQALGAQSAADVDAALRSLPALAAEELIQSHGGVAAAVRTRAAWLGSALGQAAARGPWVELTTTAGDPLRNLASVPRWLSGGAVGGAADGGLAGGGSFLGAGAPASNKVRPRELPLAGIRVLDLTRVIAGPVAMRVLAALGADVLRLDPPALPEMVEAFVDTGFDKRSAEADLADATTSARVRELLASADVVVTGYRGGALERFGLSPETLLADRPGLAVVTLNGWGHTGPWREVRGFDSIVQAAAGIADVYGTDSESDQAGPNPGSTWRPGALPVQALDHATGYGCAAAAVTLLGNRRSTGAGGVARLSLARTAEELWSLPSIDDEVLEVASPLRSRLDSSFGALEYVEPPLVDSGAQVRHRHAPPPYGSSALTWA